MTVADLSTAHCSNQCEVDSCTQRFNGDYLSRVTADRQYRVNSNNVHCSIGCLVVPVEMSVRTAEDWSDGRLKATECRPTSYSSSPTLLKALIYAQHYSWQPDSFSTIMSAVAQREPIIYLSTVKPNIGIGWLSDRERGALVYFLSHIVKLRSDCNLDFNLRSKLK